MAAIAYREPECDELTRGITSVISYWPVNQKMYWHDARICLGENPTESFKLLIFVTALNYCARQSMVGPVSYTLLPKNYMRNYAYVTEEYQPQHITYKRALRNLTVLMFSHYINHLENTRALEGHWTLMVHKCLTVASTLGCFHQWQRQVELGDRDKPEWIKIPAVAKNDFRYKYSTTLVLMGRAKHPAYGHPKMLGHCFDNVYHQGQFIGDLQACGRNPTEEHTKEVYDQEYEELVAWLEGLLVLSRQGMAYRMILTSLLNPEIVLHPKAFREREGMLEVPLGCIPPPWSYTFDGAQGLVDLSWDQWAPTIQQDEVDKNPL